MARRLEFTLHGQVLPPPKHDPMVDRKETLKYLWVLLRGEGERGGQKDERWGKPGWLVEGHTSNWLRFIWPEVSGQDLSNLAAWCSQMAARYEGFMRLGEARERRDGEKSAPGRFFVADDFNVEAVPQYVARPSNPNRRTAKEDIAGAMAQIAELKDAVAKTERERDEWVVECDKLLRQVKHAPQTAELERVAELEKLLAESEQQRDRALAHGRLQKAVFDEQTAEIKQLRDMLAMRVEVVGADRELEALREESEGLRRALAERDATIRAMDDKLAATREEIVALKTREVHVDCVPEDLFRNVERENRALDRKLGLLGKHLDLASEVLEG